MSLADETNLIVRGNLNVTESANLRTGHILTIEPTLAVNRIKGDVQESGGNWFLAVVDTINPVGTFPDWIQLNDLSPGLNYWTEATGVNYSSFTPINAAINAAAIITPKGSGSFQISSTGDPRGSFTVDLQMIRSNNSQVASGDYSFLNGNNSTVSGNYSAVISGNNNEVSGNNSAITSGQNAIITGNNSIIIGSDTNTNNGNSSTIAAGFLNTINSDNSFCGNSSSNILNASSMAGVGDRLETNGINSIINCGVVNKTNASNNVVICGGIRNEVGTDAMSGINAMVGSGDTNHATVDNSFIGAGNNNNTNGINSFIGAGSNNNTMGNNSGIIAGVSNNATGDNSFVGAGSTNTSSTDNTGVGGGNDNIISGSESVIGGGSDNIISGSESVIIGGSNNNITTNNDVIIGGENNSAANGSVIGGGSNNNNNQGSYIRIGGGVDNRCRFTGSTVCGGLGNTANSNLTIIGGGVNNFVNQVYSNIGGGFDNIIEFFTHSSVIAGGSFNIIISLANNSFCAGRGLFLEYNQSSALSQYNKITPLSPLSQQRIFMVGNGTSDALRNNAFSVRRNGECYADDNFNAGGADFAEWFESSLGEKIEAGVSIVLDNGLIRAAKNGEIPFGVISEGPGFVGNSCESGWIGKYARDLDNNIIEEEIMIEEEEEIMTEETITTTKIIKIKKNGEVFYKKTKITETIKTPVMMEYEIYDENEPNVKTISKPKTQMVKKTIKQKKLNPAFNSKLKYIPRSQRPEWNIVGLLGQVPVLKGQPLNPKWQVIKEIDENYTLMLILP